MSPQVSIPFFTLLLAAASCGSAQQPQAAQPQAAATPVASQSEIDVERRMRTEVMSGDLDEILKRRHLRVLVIPDRLGFFYHNGQMGGASYEAMMEFERLLNQKNASSKLPVSVIFLPVRRDQALRMLAEGRGDIALGRIAVTGEAQKSVDFTDPIYPDAKVVLVTGPKAPAVTKLEDLAGKEIQIVAGAQTELVAGLNASLQKQGLQPVRLKAMDDNLKVDDVLEMVNAGLVPMTAVEVHVAQIWSAALKDLKVRPELVLAEAPIAWALRKQTPNLKAAFNEFIKTHKVGTAYGSTVMRRYYNNPKWVRNATAGEDAAKFKQMLTLFEKYGQQFDFPTLLVAAQAYQESRLNQSLKSSAGAVGVMQIKPSTAAGSPINISPVTTLDNNIKAGVKYMRFIYDQYFKDAPMDRVNKALFSIASYNAGPNRVRQLRAEAKASGLDENKWFNNVEIIAAKRIGRETTTYVANIYKYYLAYKQITEAQQAGKAAAK